MIDKQEIVRGVAVMIDNVSYKVTIIVKINLFFKKVDAWISDKGEKLLLDLKHNLTGVVDSVSISYKTINLSKEVQNKFIKK